MDVAVVARRARTENFPVASILFPRHLRPHLRAVYGFARLVDILGDEIEGDRLAALDELERELEVCYSGRPSWPVMAALQPTIEEFTLPREPFLRLIEANRMDQRITVHLRTRRHLEPRPRPLRQLQQIPRPLAVRLKHRNLMLCIGGRRAR
jgi:phytoene/squalene synthetase